MLHVHLGHKIRDSILVRWDCKGRNLFLSPFASTGTKREERILIVLVVTFVSTFSAILIFSQINKHAGLFPWTMQGQIWLLL